MLAIIIIAIIQTMEIVAAIIIQITKIAVVITIQIVAIDAYEVGEIKIAQIIQRFAGLSVFYE